VERSSCPNETRTKVRFGGTPKPAPGTGALPGVLRATLLLILWATSALAAPSIEELVRQLSANSVEVRREAAYQLEHLGATAAPALPALIQAMEDPDKQVWSHAIAAIANLGPAASAAIPALLEQLDTREMRNRRERDRVQTVIRAAYALSRIGRVAIPKLLPALESQDSGVRAGAARALGGMGPAAKAAIPGLRANLGHHEGFVRREIVDALGQIGPAAVAPLLEALAWNEPAQRISAALALGQIGREATSAGPALGKLLGAERDPLVRAAALTALPKVSADPARVLPLLIAGWKSEHEPVRSAATGALLAFRPPTAAIAALLPLLREGHPAEVERAVALLGRFGSAVKSAAPELVAFALNQQPPPPPLVEVLVQLGSASAPALISVFAQEKPDALTKDHWLVRTLRTIGEPAVAPLTAALGDARIGVRFGAVRALGEMGVGARSAINALLPLTADADPRVRAMTLGTLAAARTDAKVLREKLGAALDDPDAIVRLTALQLVPYLGEEGAPLDEKVRAALQDRDETVRAAARALLK
jgi:HEAT repeat protein